LVGRFTYTNGRLQGYINALPAKADRLAGKLAADVEARAKERAPVDTGALRSSITHAREGQGVFRVWVGVDYGLFLEVGTYKSRAQPYFYPAFTEVAKTVEALAKAELAP
jgi:HK97 gp10 family phage protein